MKFLKSRTADLFRALLIASWFINSNTKIIALPVVINTWPFTNATQSAWEVISSGRSALDAVEAGCGKCEQFGQCGVSVGYGHHPDELGEVTLDAMIMDGITHNVGAVGDLRRVRSAISVARAVLNYTTSTLLVGESATKFAVEMGFKEESLSTNQSQEEFNDWKQKKCQPNYWVNVSPDPKTTCGPYKPMRNEYFKLGSESNQGVSERNHDTVGMLVVDKNHNIAGGVTTNGLDHKIHGRVGDSPIAGAGAYVDNDVGGAAGTGDGDVMMRFLPSYFVVEQMRSGINPSDACNTALRRILKYYPDFSGALIGVTVNGTYGGACHNTNFHFSLRNPSFTETQVVAVTCI